MKCRWFIVLLCLVLANPINMESILKLFTFDCQFYKWLKNYNYEGIKDTYKQPNPSLMNIYLYKDTSKEIYSLPTAASQLLASSLFDINLPVIIFLHGIIATMDSPIVTNMVEVFNKKGIYNVMALDPYDYIRNPVDYFKSIVNSQFIGDDFGNFLVQLTAGGVLPSQIHLIGHSLGAHLAGFGGKYLTRLTGTKVGRISGLDVAGPCYFKAESRDRLDKGDADFVDVIHSDSGDFGIDKSIGHVDFFPNGGKKQPKQPLFNILASHNMSWIYYASSVDNPTGFVSLQCSNIWEYLFKKCSNNPRAYMGFGASSSDANGNYYLSTSSRYPYYLGDAGVDPLNFLSVFFGFQ